MSDMKKLLRTIPQLGKVDFISIRSERKTLPTTLKNVKISIKNGLEGDHYKGKSRKRQVTLIQAEHLKAMTSLLEKDKIDPLLTRRNIVVSGINLLAFKNMQFQIGANVILEMTGACHPCTQMETNFGEGGEIKIGDKVQLINLK